MKPEANCKQLLETDSVISSEMPLSNVFPGFNKLLIITAGLRQEQLGVFVDSRESLMFPSLRERRRRSTTGTRWQLLMNPTHIRRSDEAYIWQITDVIYSVAVMSASIYLWRMCLFLHLEHALTLDFKKGFIKIVLPNSQLQTRQTSFSPSVFLIHLCSYPGFSILGFCFSSYLTGFDVCCVISCNTHLQSPCRLIKCGTPCLF